MKRVDKLGLLLGAIYGLGFLAAGVKLIWLGIHSKITDELSFSAVSLSAPALNHAHVVIGIVVILLGLAVGLVITYERDRELF